MILVTKFKIDPSKLQLEAEMVWDSDTETMAMMGIIHVPLDTHDPYSGTVIIRQPMDRFYSDIPGCALLDLIGDYNKQGKVLDIQLLTALEYMAILKEEKKHDVTKQLL